MGGSMREKYVEQRLIKAVRHSGGHFRLWLKKIFGAISLFFAVLRVDCLETNAIRYTQKICGSSSSFYICPEHKTLPGILTIESMPGVSRQGPTDSPLIRS